MLGANNVELVNCTIANNSAGLGDGGGIYSTTSPVNILNSIIWENEASNSLSLNNAIVNYSLIEGGFEGTGENNINEDPLFCNPDTQAIIIYKITHHV